MKEGPSVHGAHMTTDARTLIYLHAHPLPTITAALTVVLDHSEHGSDGTAKPKIEHVTHRGDRSSAHGHPNQRAQRRPQRRTITAALTVALGHSERGSDGTTKPNIEYVTHRSDHGGAHGHPTQRAQRRPQRCQKINVVKRNRLSVLLNQSIDPQRAFEESGVGVHRLLI